MANDLIRYDLLVQDALRSVVRKVMQEAAKEGLPGEHHFYITFRTTAPGVRLSSHMRAQYPDVMTVILQHQFWDLAVSEHNFEVGLSFRNIPERLLVPFEAVTEFYDPSVQFGLKFEVEEVSPEDGANDLEPIATPPAARSLSEALAATTALPTPARKQDVAKAEPAKADSAKTAKPKKDKDKEKAADETPAEPDSDPGKVVSIDAFRKKH
ncbi:MAG: stringent starvation family protein [Hyphomicrobiales bacterium]|nr:stringent starvation family protein [Hyphomicrobiales bacterium]